MDERQLETIETAADWADRYDELDEAERRELAQWLSERPEHARAFARIRQVLSDAALLEAVDTAPSRDARMVDFAADLPRSRPLPRTRFSRLHDALPTQLGRRQALAAGLAALVAAPLGGYLLTRRQPASAPDPLRFASDVGQRRHVVLPDGSSMLLDAASSVRVHFTPERRGIELDRGAARFDVRHDAARPFEVRTPGAAMTALGTSFSVDRLSDAAELRVFSGRVAMAAHGQQPLVVPARQWALFDGRAIDEGSFDPAAHADWQNDWLDAESMRLGFAIERLSRYSADPIRLQEPSLASRTFSGRFRLDEPEQSLALIGALFGLRPSKRADGIYLVAA
ncbi:FecR domain-containing protein [Novosphingobium sp.]|uniref:FecR family protein n=1 Tax=Novosphingobium sp. TaxID=1874826 RepID=UPI0028AC503D|nr:FecR domain-containing protein [Novosphingobium sp.]